MNIGDAESPEKPSEAMPSNAVARLLLRIGDISRFDHPAECGPEVMPRCRDLAARIAGLPRVYPFTGRGAFQYPIFGRLDSRGAYKLVAFHLQLHVPQIRRSIELNSRA